jgi:(E)-4-hydroxy-3-methyl-but-2-enyl pyrophosphate reductase
MEILLAQHSGFCFGVKRAIQMAMEASEHEQPIYTLGPLIHNPQMVEELKQHGIIPVENPEDLHDSTVIVRSHGISRSDKEILLANRNKLIDATCPIVSKAQKHVMQLCAEQYPVIIMGDRNHPEVIAMLSYCDGKTLVVAGPDELPDELWDKLGVISQTTKNLKTLQGIVARLVPKVKELKLFNTICTATSLRQEASAFLAKNCDLMIIIGGRNSSNTRMLAALCAEITETLHIETADELTPGQISRHNRIGLSAGASTPDYLIVDVYNRINEITGDRTSVKSVEDIPVNKEKSC